ncbi:hypothetical protein [Rhodovarius lipocyclicus]|uniref:hypothetical protein n=1 Tax=Rhodovarius lipocyclicus TaxID=268410 RepID=UPI001356D0D3|nr:hypothetical protein [Rhodovarius lipocyclicus]
MVAGRVFFLALSALIALVGLFTAARSEGYLNFFGFALLAFGVLFGLSVVKRHFDEADAH